MISFYVHGTMKTSNIVHCLSSSQKFCKSLANGLTTFQISQNGQEMKKNMGFENKVVQCLFFKHFMIWIALPLYACCSFCFWSSKKYCKLPLGTLIAMKINKKKSQKNEKTMDLGKSFGLGSRMNQSTYTLVPW